MAKRIGVLAVQGDFAEHIAAMNEVAGAEAFPVKTAAAIEDLDGLIIPGGESTTIGKLCERFGLDQAIIAAHARGMAIWGTCAGLIYMATDIADRPEQQRLGLLHCRVKRNAFGRQVDSFETDLQVEGLEGGETRAVFIRAPYVEAVQNGVRVLSVFNDRIVAVREGRLLGTAFHPELTDDRRVQRYFLQMIDET
ncbi:MAG: pyridoxal 5'-phosphate synthase glutaminase subunit PdxT [Armatimonadetes bacterium]|nr:pyridoxal 5'-phosphate synthase glutaminase subunit PdxT [Armatimonadota bacterium]